MQNQSIFTLRQSAIILLITLPILLQTACVPFYRTSKDSQNSRNYQSSSNPLQNFSNQPRQEVLAEVFNKENPSDVFRNEIYTLLMAKDFTSIEKIAAQVRKTKERVVGGYWKIHLLYEAVTNHYADYKGQKISIEMWKNRIELLKQWKEQSPNSITSRVALAKGYVEYGWFIRGGGTINTVSEENYNDFQKNLDIAAQEFSEAYALEEKCPGWYRETLYLAIAKSWSREDFEKLFDEAVKFEPDYVSVYLVKAHYLSPKWHGELGDWQKFFDALPGKLATVNSKDADMIYFIVAANKISDSSENVNWAMVSKEKINKGFEDLEKKYQADNYRLNQYAYLSFVTGDFPTAKTVFDRIGDNYDKSVWGEKTFKAMKQVAENQPSIAKK